MTQNSGAQNQAAQTYHYDARGNITGIIDGNGNTTRYDLDDWGRIVQIITPEDGTECYTYDFAGNITSTTDANGGTITYKYNSQGKVCEIIDQEGLSEYFYYDAEGQLITHIDREGNRITTAYNRDGNIVFRQGCDAEQDGVITESFRYYSDGMLSDARTKGMAYHYTYTLDGNLESKSASGRDLLAYTYTPNGKIASIKDVTGKSTYYSYDTADRTQEIADEIGKALATYSYDGDQNVKSLVTVTPTGEVLVDYRYAYDLNGNHLNKVGSKHQVYYSYDKMNRLTESSYDGRQENFTYDRVGNRLTKTTNGVTEKYCYNVKNQLKELHQNSGITYFTYSPQGNTIKEATPTGTNNYSYNAFNQQVKAEMQNGETLISRYDAEGLRHEIEENERLVKFIFHKENVLVETDGEENCISRFARGYEIVGAEIRGIGHRYNTYYYYPDEQGSALYITDEEASTKNSYFYDAFGNVLNSEELVHNRITYVGQQFDGITQQYYLPARYYNPVIGRFTQEDSYRGDGLNLYAYCQANPVIYYDFSGYASNKGKCWSKENPFDLDKEANKYSSKAAKNAKVKGIYDDTAQHSDILRNELKKAGIQPPPYGNAAHHIVAWNDPRAKEARKILKKVGIDFDSAANGVFLPYEINKYVSTEALHIGSHAKSYMDKVNDTLKKLSKSKGKNLTQEDVLGALDDIRKKLLTGKLKLN